MTFSWLNRFDGYANNDPISAAHPGNEHGGPAMTNFNFGAGGSAKISTAYDMGGGGRCLQWTNATSGTASFCDIVGFNSTTFNFSFEWIVDSTLQAFGNPRTGAATSPNAASLQIDSSHRLFIGDQSGNRLASCSTGDITPYVGHLWRVSGYVVSDAANGTTRLSVYDITTSTSIYDSGAISGRATKGGPITLFRFPRPGATPGPTTVNIGAFQFDDNTTPHIFGAFPTSVAPLGNAGAGFGAVEPYSTVTHVGTDSDSDGSVVARQWTQVSGTTVTLTGATSATMSYTAPATLAGDTLTFQYVVTDDDALTSNPSTVTDVVLPHTTWRLDSGGPVPVQIIRI